MSSTTTRRDRAPSSRPTAGRVEPLSEQHREGVFSLYGEVFGASKAEKLRRRFDWWYRQSPFLGADQVSNWVMTRDSQVVGHLGVLPVRIKVGERSLQASWLCDYVVREGSRLGKTFLKMTTLGSESSDFPMGYGMAPNVARTYRKLGWKQQSVSAFLVKPLRLRGIPLLFRNGWRGKRLGSSVSQAIGTLLPGGGARSRQGALARAAGETWTRSSEFDASFDALWSRASVAHVIAVERTRAYLRWRYPRRDAEGAKIVGVEDRGGLCGFAIVEKVRWRGVVTGLISELVAGREEASRLLAAVEGLFRRERVSAMITEGFPALLRESFRAQGFLEEPGDRQLMVFFDRHGLCPAPLLEDSGNWLLTPGDSDRSVGLPRVPWRES